MEALHLNPSKRPVKILPEHTSILLNCYILLKSTDDIERFVDSLVGGSKSSSKGAHGFDMDNAVRVRMRISKDGEISDFVSDAP